MLPYNLYTYLSSFIKKQKKTKNKTYMFIFYTHFYTFIIAYLYPIIAYYTILYHIYTIIIAYLYHYYSLFIPLL